jgi:hypothetical protein
LNYSNHIRLSELKTSLQTLCNSHLDSQKKVSVQSIEDDDNLNMVDVRISNLCRCWNRSMWYCPIWKNKWPSVE